MLLGNDMSCKVHGISAVKFKMHDEVVRNSQEWDICLIWEGISLQKFGLLPTHFLLTLNMCK